ncbi:MAG: CBS domain-containing protein [Byssovorax sp.]
MSEQDSTKDAAAGAPGAAEAKTAGAETTDTAAERPSSEEIVEIEPGPGEPPPLPKAASHAPPPGDEPAPMSVTNSMPAPAWPPRVVGDLMARKVITLGEDEPIGDLESWMARFRFRHLPVVGGDMQLVGLISQKDYLHALLGVAPDGARLPPVDATTKASAIMRKTVVFARIDSPLSTACEVMVKEKIGCLPVVLDDMTLVGIITDTDLVRLAGKLLDDLR